jgi:hypothetical protein
LLPGWVTLLEYGSVATAAAIILWHRFVRPTVPAAQRKGRRTGLRTTNLKPKTDNF